MESVQRNLWWSLGLGMVCALGTLPINIVVGEGAVLGVASGALGLSMMGRRLRALGSIPSERLQRTIYEWMAVRMGVYAVAFSLAYMLDRTHMYGLLGAVGGMLAFRFVFIGVTVVMQRRSRQ